MDCNEEKKQYRTKATTWNEPQKKRFSMNVCGSGQRLVSLDVLVLRRMRRTSTILKTVIEQKFFLLINIIIDVMLLFTK